MTVPDRDLARRIHSNVVGNLTRQANAVDWQFNPMTGGWTAVIKPFYNPDPPWRVRFNSDLPASEPLEDGEVLISWTAKSEVTTIDELTYGSITIEDPEQPEDETIELERLTHTERVTNPEDPDQWVDVEVVDRLTLINPKSNARRIINFLNSRR